MFDTKTWNQGGLLSILSSFWIAVDRIVYLNDIQQLKKV